MCHNFSLQWVPLAVYLNIKDAVKSLKLSIPSQNCCGNCDSSKSVTSAVHYGISRLLSPPDGATSLSQRPYLKVSYMSSMHVCVYLRPCPQTCVPSRTLTSLTNFWSSSMMSSPSLRAGVCPVNVNMRWFLMGVGFQIYLYLTVVLWLAVHLLIHCTVV